METNVLLKKFRHTPISSLEAMKHRVAYGLDDIKRTIAHREPFLFLDRIDGLDIEREEMIATRFIAASDPVFLGHFPEFPVYPGTLLIEMMGQMASALAFFLQRGDHRIPADAAPLHVRATKVLAADFLEPILPDSHITMIAKRIYDDDFCSRFAGQAMVDGKVCCIGAGELYIF